MEQHERWFFVDRSCIECYYDISYRSAYTEITRGNVKEKWQPKIEVILSRGQPFIYDDNYHHIEG